MAEPKTAETDASVTDFLDSVDDERKRRDSYALLACFIHQSWPRRAIWTLSRCVGAGLSRV